VIRLWHLSSLDAPTVAVVWTLAFAWAAGVRLPIWVPAFLGLGTWAVYVIDRVLDAHAALRTTDLNCLAARHHFHHRHRGVLIPLAMAAACGAGCIVFTLMPVVARERNSILAVAALAYFTRVHSTGALSARGPASMFRLMKKELLVGLIFTAACALPAISRVGAGARLSALCGAAVLFAMLAWLNCHAIDRWEREERSAGSEIFSKACLLGVACMVTAGAVAFIHPRIAALLLAGGASSLLLALLDRLRDRLTPIALRAAADLVLLAPLALLMR
jgi:hypothetical protein